MFAWPILQNIQTAGLDKTHPAFSNKKYMYMYSALMLQANTTLISCDICAYNVYE